MRIEHTSVDYSAPQMVFDSTGALVSCTNGTGSDSYTQLLPGIHLRHGFTDNTILRASFSRTLARPNYGDIAPFVSQTVSDLRISKGNPALMSTTSNNSDITLEHYFNTLGVASVGVFRKDLDDYIFTTVGTELIGTDTYTVTQSMNGTSATLYGVEGTFTNQFRFLPGAFSGIGVYMNYTHIHSTTTLPATSALPGGRGSACPARPRTSEMPRFSTRKYGISVRLAANFQGRYLLAVGSDAGTDNWLDDRTELDFSASKQITRNFRLFVDMLNLTNDPYRVFQGTSNHPIQEERYKMWWTAGVKVNF